MAYRDLREIERRIDADEEIVRLRKLCASAAYVLAVYGESLGTSIARQLGYEGRSNVDEMKDWLLEIAK